MANAARTETATERAKRETSDAETAEAPPALSGGENGAPASPTPLFETLSGIPVKPLYGPVDVKPGLEERLGEPGKFPFTRGLHPEMYRKRLWTMRDRKSTRLNSSH